MDNLLGYVYKAIETVPQVIKYLSPAYKSQEYFLSQITGLVRGVYGGFIGGDFIDTMANLISGQLWDAYQSAWFDEGGIGELPEYLQSSYQVTVANQYAFVDGFYRDVIDARVDKTGIEPLLARADLWAQRWLESYNEAVRLITIDGGGNLVWQLGATEEHCPECAALNGLVMSAKQWNQIGVRPQNAPNKNISCGGWRCDCSLSPTDKRRSPNAYGRIEIILLAKKSIKGGEGSGNFGHAGRPGEVGGSAPSSDASDDTTAPSMSDSEMTALTFYKEEGYRDINFTLRNGGEYESEIINPIDSAIANSETTSNLVLYRGVSPSLIDQMNEGEVFNDLGYTSATRNINTAEDFGIEFGRNIVMEIHVPKGSNALNLDRAIEAARDEEEYLLPRNSNFQIRSIETVKDDNGKIYQYYVVADYEK